MPWIRPRRPMILLALALALAVNGSPAQDKPERKDQPKLERKELAARGKAVTAYAFSSGHGGGAVCVHPSGLFLTSPRGALTGRHDAEIRVVLNPATPDQKVLPAKVVRMDLARNLLLVQVEGVANLSAVSLGSPDELTELAELAAFGFASDAPKGKDEYPALSAVTRAVSSVARQGRAVVGARLAEPLPARYEGGPLLAPNGTLVGLATSHDGPTAAPVTHAVSVAVIRDFLNAPVVRLEPPKIDPAGAGKPATFTAEVLALVPDEKKPAVELLLDLGDGPTRKFPMEFRDGSYRATVVPAPWADAAVRVTARFGAVTLSGPVADREFTVGGKPVRLRDVRRLEPGLIPKVTKVDGSAMSGEIDRLSQVEVKLADQVLRIDLGKADAVDLVAPGAPASLTCTVVATVDGKEVGRASVGGALARAGGPTSAAPTAGAPKLEGDRVTRKLPEAFADVCAGAGGRYLLFLLPKAGKIAVFDVPAAKIVHYFPAPDASARFAAGRDAVVIGLPTQGILQRWSLKSFERELSVTFARQEPLGSVHMGHASDGPVLINGGFFDLRTLKPLDVKGPNNLPAPQVGGGDYRTSVSADGTVYGVWATNSSPAGLRVCTLSKGELRDTSRHTTSGHIVPGPDGREVYTTGSVYTPELRVVHDSKDARVNFLPAARGNLYLGVTMLPHPGGNDVQELEVSAYVSGDSRPLVKVGRLKGNYEFGDFRSAVGLRNRVWLVPDARVLVTLPASNDVVELTRFDLDDALAKADVDYLFIASDPPAGVRKGERYSHQLQVKSKRGEVKYKVETGPAGMTVGANGVIQWAVPGTFADKSASVIVAVSDASGQEVFKTFTINVGE